MNGPVKMCRIYDTKMCKSRQYVFSCWLRKFRRIPRFCISPHRTSKDECRATGDERVWASVRFVRLSPTNSRPDSGFTDRKTPRPIRTVYIQASTNKDADTDGK